MELRNRVSSLGATVNSNIPKRNPVSWLGSKNRSPPKTAIAHQNNCLGLRNRVSFFGATVNSNIPKRNPVSCLGVKTRSRSVPEGIAHTKSDRATDDYVGVCSKGKIEERSHLFLSLS
ncbi:hypothetical protein [Planktothricoides raciborskii]|uniref:Uncharacterized protein n=1 Tax=Planktothricoides raciborskii FACHB-1370 TaxID=2949576 RepID=A0ABR8E6K5_9CYAN|nr:hypothetical protein [Planktothricoides raciborskii]MBD2542303.1 hypothetical protein [Planktothricoides raciborskii FACHB-1370]MBD2585895.1 hypothetical protein [Planktothricoides raciborskii FACHB-1261]